MPAGCTHEEAIARAALINVQSYDIFLDLTSDPGAVRSRTEIRFRCREPGAATDANLATDTVHHIQLNGQALDPAEVVTDGNLHLPGLASGNVLTVDAESAYLPGDPDLSRFTDPADGAQYMLATPDSISVPRLLCCFNQPGLRADLTLSVAAPPGWECVSNGAVTARPEPGQGGHWQFATVPHMRAMDVSLCAGPYVTAVEENLPSAAGPIPLRLACRRSLAHEPGLARIAAVISRSLLFYERLLGVPCPYPNYSVVFPPAPSGNAMQSPGLMLVSEKLIQQAADPEDDYVTWVLAHEVAHLWFGGLVTYRWWDDLWLCEALADYLSETARDEAFGLPAVWASYGMRRKPEAYQTDSVPGVEAVSSPVETNAEARARPASITYGKGASVVRQLAALIGDDALRAGLRDFLTRYGGGCETTLDDIVGCWSRASGRDLTEWAGQWLRTPGVNTLRPELTLAPDGTIAALAILQDEPARIHRVSIGLYDRQDGRPHLRHRVYRETKSSMTAVSGLIGQPAPDVLIVNDQDLTFALTRFDDRSLRNLTESALDVGDPLAEAVCWTAAWDMTTAAELPASDFTGLVVRRIAAARMPVALDVLLQRALTAADYYAPPAQRSGLRQRLAAASLDAIGRVRPASRTQRQLAVRFAASAETGTQLTLLRSWLTGTSLPGGAPADLELRAQVLATLSARGLATDADLDAYAAADPVAGLTHAATCRAMRPDPEAKEAAWTAALDAAQPTNLAIAHATGIWVPGQDDILIPYRDRYFSEALPILSTGQIRISRLLSRLLYPLMLADQAALNATETCLGGPNRSRELGRVLPEQAQILRQIITARAKAGQAG